MNGSTAESSTVQSPRPDRRSWYRLHRSTWALAGLGVLAAILLVVPGEIGWYPDQDSLKPRGVIVHGWPIPYLWRTPAESDDFSGWKSDPAQAAPTYAWRLTDSVSEISWLALSLDVGILIVGLTGFTALVEWRRRHRPIFQFTIAQMLGVVGIASIVLAWWGHRRMVERDVRERLDNVSSSSVVFEPRLPLWLRNLVGDERLLWLGCNGPKRFGYLTWNLHRQDDIRQLLQRFPHEIVVGLHDTADEEVAISKIDELERIECLDQPPADLTRLLTALEKHPGIRYLSIASGREAVDDAAVTRIATLPRLESLSIQDASHLTADGLGQLKNCQNLSKLRIDRVKLSTEALFSLGELKQLCCLSLTAADLSQADLSNIRLLGRLEELDLWGSGLTDDGVRHLRALPRLKSLDLGGNSGVTAAGIKALLEPMGDSHGAEDARSCTNLQNLEWICLTERQIDTDVLAVLKRCTTLRRIAVCTDPSPNPRRARNRPGKNYSILQLQRALADRKIIDVPVFDEQF